MSALRFSRSRAPRRFGVALTTVLALAASGCGFHPVGSTGELPSAMRVTYVASGEPYGYLENRLRREIVASGAQVTQDRAQASAVFVVMNADLTRRVLAVSTRGQPLQYSLNYNLRFQLLNAKGEELLAPQSLELRRDLAYNVNIELGASRRQAQLLRDMQDEAVRLVMLRLEAVARQEKAPNSSR